MDYTPSQKFPINLYFSLIWKRYIVPLVKPPTPPELEADKALVTAKFDEAQQILETLKADTAELRESQEKQRQQVEEALDLVEKAVSELKESGNRRDASIRGFKADIDSIRELIPKVPFCRLQWKLTVRLWNGIKKHRPCNYKIYRTNSSR